MPGPRAFPGGVHSGGPVCPAGGRVSTQGGEYPGGGYLGVSTEGG